MARVLHALGVSWGTCTQLAATSGRCEDAPDVEVDVRMYEMAVIMDLCPRNRMSRCLCHDNTVMKAPFDLQSFYFQCRPKKAS